MAKQPKPAKGPRKIEGPMTELGATGLKQYGGILSEEFLYELRGKRGAETYTEMSENDPVVGAVLFAIEMLIRQVSWDVEPAGDEESDLANAAFLRSCMDDVDVPWSEVIAERLSMLTYGWEACHPVYKLRRGQAGEVQSEHDDGKIGWRKLPTRAQDTLLNWEMGDHSEVEGATFNAPPRYAMVTIQSDRLLLFRTTSRRGSPEGKSILRNAYKPWYFKSKIEVYEAIGVERDLAGMPVAKVPMEWLGDSASAAEKSLVAEIKRIVRNIRMDEQMGVVFPRLLDDNGNDMITLDLMAAPGAKQIKTGEIVNRYNQMIAVCALADFVLLGQQKVGSFALASSKTEIFATALGAWCKSIADTLNRVEVPRLFALNGYSGILPRIVAGDIEERDLGQLGEYLGKLAGAGMMLFPDDELERYCRRAAGLPEPADDKPDDDGPRPGDDIGKRLEALEGQVGNVLAALAKLAD